MTVLSLIYLLAVTFRLPSPHAIPTSMLGGRGAVNVAFPQYEYKSDVHSIREIDFKNFQYRLLGERVRLRNGLMNGDARRLEGENVRIHLEVTLKHVWYFDFHDDQPRHALISLNFFSVGASSSERGFLLLFEIINGHPVITQQFDYDRQAPGAGDNFNWKLGILTIKGRADDDSPHCCPENLETDAFRWRGQKFALRTRKITKLPLSSG